MSGAVGHAHRHRRPGAILLTAVVAFGLAGCASNAGQDQAELSDLFSSKDQQRQVASCLQERGWDSTFDESNNAVVTNVEDAQRSMYDADMAECSELAGVDMTGQLSEQEYKLTYDWYSDIAACLAKKGWIVPDRPTFQSFQSSYNDDPWIPWIEVPAGEMDDARQACPVINVPRS